MNLDFSLGGYRGAGLNKIMINSSYQRNLNLMTNNMNNNVCFILSPKYDPVRLY